MEIPAGCNPDCSGCRHRGWPEAESLAQKQAYLARALAPFADVLEPVRSPPPGLRLGYRQRVTLAAGPGPDGCWTFGLTRRRRGEPDRLVPIPDCPVHSPRIAALLGLLAARLPPPDELRLAALHVAGGQASLVVKSPPRPTPWAADLAAPLKALGIDGLWVNFHPAAGRRLFAKRGWHLLAGEARSRDPAGLLHGPGAFQQLQPGLYAEAIAEARGFLAPALGDRVLDLCSGIGGTLRAWTDTGADVLGVELAAGAVECARLNAPHATVLAGTCEQRLPQVRAWWPAGDGRRLLFANPPRSGLEPGVVEALAEDLRPEALAYLSCSAGTLARDLGLLVAAGYRVRRLLPWDFFPQTHHVEVLALADRRD